MTRIINTKSKLRRPAALLTGMASFAFLALTTFAISASADDHRDDHGNGHHEDHRSDHGRDYHGGGYYRAPPVVYGSPYYSPPPVIYGPGIGVILPGVNIHIR